MQVEARSNVTLIANSGVQFLKVDLTINSDDMVMSAMGFQESFDETDGNEGFKLGIACYLPDEDVWVSKDLLREEGFIDENERIANDVNMNVIWPLEEDDEYYTISDIEDALENYLNKWLPIPFFKESSSNGSLAVGPKAWSRIYIRKIGDGKEYKVVLAFDTRVLKNTSDYLAPRIIDTHSIDNTFRLCDNEDLLLAFCGMASNDEGANDHLINWVGDYIEQQKSNDNLDEDEFGQTRFLAKYIYLIKYLAKMGVFPKVRLYSDQQETKDVDLVLDVGNSNTCALLFENYSTFTNKAFDFNRVKRLKLQDISCPDLDYTEPFSMRLAFARSGFGEIYPDDYPNSFSWPSFLRVGKEAERLINQDSINKNSECVTHHSSPKRYLWDSDKSHLQWEFTSVDGVGADQIYAEGISEQFKGDGSFALDGNQGITSCYSRKSLMTFVFIEILLHAESYVNSWEFRSEHGDDTKPRKIKRITITCPTSIVQDEQVSLRRCAQEAVIALDRVKHQTYNDVFEPDVMMPNVSIVPDPKDLAKKLSVLETRKDWMYDEATCVQLVFLYAELSKRYLNDCELFFELFGRNDVDQEKTLTIASLDIGGGTTDLMICKYAYDSDQGVAVLTPKPVFWESFNLAGDDLLKNIIQQVVLEGKDQDNILKGCKGVIENYARSIGVPNVADKMNNFFGTDSSQQGYKQRIVRKNFIVQVAVPIALAYIQHTINDADDPTLRFKDIFTEIEPNNELIEFVNNHFGNGFDFKSIEWSISQKRVESLVDITFDELFKQLSVIIDNCQTDFLLLAGKPSNIPRIRELFLKYHAVSPDRLININEYRVGRWYPFATDTGYFQDTKTCVGVGAVIALMGGKLDKLDGFRLNSKHLIKSLVSTADYIGVLNKSTERLDHIIFQPSENKADVMVGSLPFSLGYRQLNSDNYESRPIYKITFNDQEIKRKLNGGVVVTETTLGISADEVDAYKYKLKSRLPFNITLRREFKESKEVIKVERIQDSTKAEISKKLLSFSLMTLNNESGYWLDTGEFTLDINDSSQ